MILSENRPLRLTYMTLLYGAQGVPVGLFVIALAAWLASKGASAAGVATIIASAFGPWTFKFFAAPVMDRYVYRAMGRRRPWLLGAQAVMFLGFATGAFLDPTASDVGSFAWLAFAIFLGSAVQDVAIDALAVDMLSPREQGTANAFMSGGQALGVAFGGALGGVLLDDYGARAAFLAFLPIYGAILLLIFVIRERPGERLLPWSEDSAPTADKETIGVGWKSLATVTLTSMMARDSLVLIGSSATGRAVAGAFTAFWPVFATTHAGLSSSAYSSTIAVIGLLSAVACMWIGSRMIASFGSRASSVISYAGYALLALSCLAGGQMIALPTILFTLLVSWHVTETLAAASVNALRMRLSDKRAAATQFSAYTSLGNLAALAGAVLSARLVEFGGTKLLMFVLVCLSSASCYGFAMLRVGDRLGGRQRFTPPCTD